MKIPQVKLARDAIKEAVCEVRFDTPGSPEVAIGRLMDAPPWAGYRQDRLPSADLPEQLRVANPVLRYQPSYQLVDPSDESRLVRIGSAAVSCHRLFPYPGWHVYGDEIAQAMHAVVERLPSAKPVRLGLKYVNAFNESDHGVGAVSDLKIRLDIGDAPASEQLLMITKKTLSPSHEFQLTIASPGFVQLQMPEVFSAVVDIDIFTPDGLDIGGIAACDEWVAEAHSLLKVEFFKLIPEQVLERLSA